MKQQFLITATSFIFLMISCSTTVIAQNSISEKFSWDASSESKTLYLNVKKGTNKIQMNFDGHISEGAFDLTAYDPDGNNVGGFSLVCSNGDGTHVHIDVTDGDHNHTHVHTGGHSSHSSHSDSNTNSRSSTTTTTTVTTSDGKTKNKNKKKNKGKGKGKGKNKGKGEYSYSSSNSDSKGSKGVMKKTISDPDSGKWKFVLEASDVTGRLTAKVTQD